GPRHHAASRVRRVPAAALVFLLLCAFASVAVAAPRIGVATMQPGEIFFERFGHNAIVVDDPAFDEPISYNFGYFDMEEPGFTGNFIRGHMEYMLVALPLSQDLAYYQKVGRGVSIQWLDLEPEQARGLAAALAENARPENARYRYDYFLDNCSTRVRDAVDDALGGALATQLQGRSRGNTYRADAVRLASPEWWMWLGFDIGLGPAADRPNSRWQEAFVPMRLAEGLRDTRLPDGRPLVAEEVEVLPHMLPPQPAEAPRRWWPWLLAWLAVGAVVLWAGASRPKLLAGVALPFWLLCGVGGLLIAFIWFGTAHTFGWNNHNILLLSPLCLLALPGGWRIACGRAPGRLFGWVLALVAAGAAVALFWNWMPVLPQRNMPWICLLLPIHAALWLALGRTRATVT